MFQNLSGTESTKENIGNKKKYIVKCNYKKVYNFIHSSFYGIYGKYGV